MAALNPSRIAFCLPLPADAPTGYFIDSNLLVLLAVGAVDRTLIGKRRRVREFTPDHYDRLIVMAAAGPVSVTPNTLSEASNLLKDRDDTRFQEALGAIVRDSAETTVPSERAVRDSAFPRLGLADAVLLEAISPDRPLLTTDKDLYDTAIRRAPEAAFNFWHEQDIF